MSYSQCKYCGAHGHIDGVIEHEKVCCDNPAIKRADLNARLLSLASECDNVVMEIEILVNKLLYIQGQERKARAQLKALDNDKTGKRGNPRCQ